MCNKSALVLITISLIIFCLFSQIANGSINIGVKEGDWVEYNVTTTGNPPEEHNVTWARLEILQVRGNEVKVNSTTLARNGSVSILIMTMNVEKGQIGAWWIIPANLNPGQTFYDDFIKQNITIDGEEQLQYAGATRTVTNATVPQRVKHWDKITGVFLLSRDDLPDYTINVVAFSTNMWSPQILGLDPAIFYSIAALVAAVLFVVLLFGVIRRRKNRNGKSN